MTTINFTATNTSLWYAGHFSGPGDILYVGWQGVLAEYGWWVLVVLGVLFVTYLYTKHFVLAIMVTILCAVNVWWIEYSNIPTVPMLLARGVFVLLIAFVWLYLLQSRRVRYVDSGKI